MLAFLNLSENSGEVSDTNLKCTPLLFLALLLYSDNPSRSRRNSSVGLLRTWSGRILTPKFQFRLKSLKIVQCYASRFLLMVSMSKLYATQGGSDILLGHMMERHGLDDRNNNDEKFIDFCSFYRFVIGSTTVNIS